VVSFCRQFIVVPSLDFGRLASLPGWLVSWLGESGVYGAGKECRSGAPHPLAWAALNHALKMVVFAFMVFVLWKFYLK
jgi:hypothetical protein